MRDGRSGGGGGGEVRAEGSKRKNKSEGSDLRVGGQDVVL